jgi:uncharacterized membrane protein
MILKIKTLSIYLMSFLYVYIGIKHFLDLEYFLNIMPHYIPYHSLMIYISGLFEILFGIMLLFRKWRRFASFGLILLLISVFPANIYLAQNVEAQEAINVTQKEAVLRLPFQLLFLAIAYWHSKNNL